jgi:ligand-binding SRPBCC domain-containing protein
MSVHRLDSTQLLPITVDQAWGFFADPRNLGAITPPWLDFTLTSPDLPERMYEGLIISYTVRPLLNLRIRWVAEITHLREGEYFVDEQRAGPYAFWHHEHHFRPVAGGTEMRDIVHYAAPLGLLGDVAVRLQVRGKLRQIFAYRREALERRFGRMVSAPAGRA